MDTAIGLLIVYMKHGVITETTLTHLFLYFFRSYSNLTLEQQMRIFIDVTNMRDADKYPNTWIDLGFTLDESGSPIHPEFRMY
jgi:hypothetical protein